jgi:hypothetical protein
MQVITQKTTNVGNRYKFYWGEPVLLTIVLPDHVSKFDPKNDMAIYLGDPEGQVDSHIVLLPYYHRVITRSGATSLDITSEQFAKFYSERLRLLQPRPRADTMTTLLDFAQLHLDNVYNREEQLRHFSQGTILRQVPPDANGRDLHHRMDHEHRPVEIVDEQEGVPTSEGAIPRVLQEGSSRGCDTIGSSRGWPTDPIDFNANCFWLNGNAYFNW